MKIARVRVSHIDMSFWGEFASRQDELRLVTLMAIYPQYRHPLSSWFPREYAELRRASPVPIAAGEHETSRYGFAQIIEAQALDIIQFDIGRVGGFSEARKVCALAQAAGLPVYTHAYGMPTLHLATSDRAVSMVEYFPVPVWGDVEEAPHFDGLAVPEGGEVSIGDAPGLGATLSLAGFTPLD